MPFISGNLRAQGYTHSLALPDPKANTQPLRDMTSPERETCRFCRMQFNSHDPAWDIRYHAGTHRTRIGVVALPALTLAVFLPLPPSSHVMPMTT